MSTELCFLIENIFEVVQIGVMNNADILSIMVISTSQEHGSKYILPRKLNIKSNNKKQYFKFLQNIQQKNFKQKLKL